jgi:uncharacterized membrane protein YgcG
VAAGEAFERDQYERIERSRRAAETESGMQFWLRVGEYDGDLRLEAERLLANLVDGPRDAAAIVLVAPGARRIEILTTTAGRRRITDQACGLIVLSMTSSFAVGDLVGGLVDGFRQLGEAAGRPGEDQLAQPLPGTGRLSGRAPVPNRALEEIDGDILDAETSLAASMPRRPAPH